MEREASGLAPSDWTWAKALAMSAMLALVLLGQALLAAGLDKPLQQPSPAEDPRTVVTGQTTK
jgi:hypothetical protein